MEVRKGYQQTDVGEIPDNWDVKTISSIAKIVGGGTPSTTVAAYWGGQIPWVSAGDVSNANGRYVENTAFHISELGLASCPARKVPAGTTVIIARGATVGRMAQLRAEMTFNQTCYGLLPNGGLDQDYLYYSMLFSIKSIKALTYGTIFGTITTNSFEEWKIPFPSIAEQQAIAEALSDVDALLNSLDILIAKKRLVKQGAMQELLTGKKRLPEFPKKTGYKNTEIGVIPEDWDVMSLGKIAQMKSGEGITGAEIDQFSKYPCYGGNGLRGFTNRFTHDGKYALIGRQGALCGNVIGVDGKFFASEHAVVVTPLEQTDIQWLTYVLEDMQLNQYSESSAQPGLSANRQSILDSSEY